LIAILRDPVDRAYSNWAHLWADGLEPEPDFLAACAAEASRVADGWAPIWRYLSTGRYGEQLEALFERFPREQVLLLRYRELVDEPTATLDRVCTFLGVTTGLLGEVPARNVGSYVEPTWSTRLFQALLRQGAAVGRHAPPQVWRKASIPLQLLIQRRPANRPDLPQEARGRLVAGFAEDVARLEALTGWDLSDWTSYREGGTYSVRRSWAPSRRLVS
jgi:hypothetical protein